MSTQISEQCFLGLAAAAAYLDISVPTLRRWAAEKRLKKYRLSERLIRFDRDELAEFVRSDGKAAGISGGGIGRVGAAPE
jgi:excisionase family DNA binding protein